MNQKFRKIQNEDTTRRVSSSKKTEWDWVQCAGNLLYELDGSYLQTKLDSDRLPPTRWSVQLPWYPKQQWGWGSWPVGHHNYIQSISDLKLKINEVVGLSHYEVNKPGFNK